jgi:hypothetical protein
MTRSEILALVPDQSVEVNLATRTYLGPLIDTRVGSAVRGVETLNGVPSRRDRRSTYIRDCA